ncbi:hypothetical protein DNI29_21770 [Hymenobacter sediminis]|uniref:hypothetical protein n=1 Tax=Hymenobacter sediminis TaxID=2218621 RepID=UPI000DA67B32|nr:hypothetical protein [Hymenobacter sediminis]RPD44337.1 hypothetical protein DNI29_21770 [Hymenobacter sediminis]
MKPLKQALVTELTAALAPLLPATPSGALPKGVANAVEDLADSLLRWRANQQRPARLPSAKDSSSESDALARLMDSRLHEEEDTPLSDPAPLPPPQAPASVAAQPSPERKRRPRLPR